MDPYQHAADFLSLTNKRPAPAPVLHHPSVQRMVGPNGSAIVSVDRFIRHADLLTGTEVQRFQDWAERILQQNKSLMQGPLTTKMLRKMGYPYGKGRRRALGRLQGRRAGISNMDIVNRQSGRLQASGKVYVKVFKASVRIEFHFDTEYAAFLMFGTIKTEAHFPLPKVLTKDIHQLDVMARDYGRDMYFRNAAMVRGAYV